jgi:hypothetical protein
MSVAVTTGTPDTWDTATPVFEDPYYLSESYGVLYDIAPSGDRFVMLRRSSLDLLTIRELSLSVVERWAAELARLAPADE